MEENTFTHTQSSVFIESNKRSYQDKIERKQISILKNHDNQESRNFCHFGKVFTKELDTSGTNPQNISEYMSNKSEEEISQNECFDTSMLSLMPNNISVTEFDPNLSQSFEPWSIHRTPAKLRGIYLWSPFFKSK